MSAPAAPLPGETCPGQSTFDQSPPVRPGLSTYNGASLQNANSPGVPPPVPGTHPTAALLNTWGLQQIAEGKVIAAAILCVTGGATPTVTLVTAPGSNVVPANFTLNRTGAGVVVVTWATALLPAPVAWPVVTHVGALTSHNYHISCIPVTQSGANSSTTVYSVVDAAAFDLSFVLQIF